MDKAFPQHVATVATEIFIQIAIYSHLQEQSLSFVSVSSLSEEKLSHGSLRTGRFNSSLHFLTKGNILILSLIPQDLKKKTNS